MNFELLTRFSPLAFIPLLLACGLDIYHSRGAPVDHYVSMTLSETYGSQDILANECIQLWDSADGGFLDVDRPWLSSDLRVDWQNVASRIDFEISDGFGLLSSHSFEAEFFRKGGSSDLAIVTAGQDYLLQLSGPSCSRRR